MQTQQDSSSKAPPSADKCIVCRRAAPEWLLRVTVEDSGGLKQEGFICANCAVKLRLASEKNRDLQIDPWIHDVVARILRGIEPEQS
ncbi:MAG TPA: hypothetical protein VMV27_12575 [Candidatus Binataceae bacterium]|nr:hypothetical protein [Candidatus Binataceae bacterium]